MDGIEKRRWRLKLEKRRPGVQASSAFQTTPNLTMSKCAICQDALVVATESDEQDDNGSSSSPKTVPDDVQLAACGCHFHW